MGLPGVKHASYHRQVQELQEVDEHGQEMAVGPPTYVWRRQVHLPQAVHEERSVERRV